MRVTKDKDNLVTVSIPMSADEQYGKVLVNVSPKGRLCGRIQLSVKEAKELINKLNKVVGDA